MSERDPLDELSRKLFEAARAEQPRPELQSRASHRVPGAPAAAAGASHARPLELESAPVPAVEPARARRKLRAAYVGLALAAAACALLAWMLVPRATPRVSIRADEIEREQPGDAPAARAPAPVKTRSVPAVAPSRPDAAVRPARALVPRPSPVATLSDELAMLDRARTALASGDAPAALALLDRYDTKLRPSHLVAEAALLRIEALAKSGKTEEASRRARRFLELYPDSPLADRARAWLGSGKSAPEAPPPSQGSAP